MNFNMRKDEFRIINRMLLVKQLVALVLLTCTLFGILIAHYTIQVKKLQTEIHLSEQEAIEALRKEFTISPEEEDLDEIVEAAEEQVRKAKETWFAFSSKARASFLQYLLELARKIDKESLDFRIEKLSIAEGMLILKAQVKDYEALKVLERELRQSKLFSFIEPQDKPSFTMKITLAPTVEEL